MFLATYLPSISRLLAAITPLILLTILSKQISTTEVGKLNYFISMITILSIISDIGVPEALQKYLPISKTPANTIGSFLKLTLLTTTALSIGIFALDLITSQSIGRGFILYLSLGIVFATCHALIMSFNALGFKKLVVLQYSLNSSVFILTCIILFNFMKVGAVESLLTSRLISWALSFFVALLLLFHKKLLKLTTKISKRQLNFCINILLTSLAYILLFQWDAIFLGIKMQDEVLGVYKSVVWIASLPLALKVILETKFLKEFSQHSNELDYLSIKLKVRMQIKSIALFGAISILLSLIFGNQLLELVFTKELANSGYHYFPLIILTTFIFLLAVPLANALQSIEHENVFKLAITTNLITYCITTTMLYDSLGVKVFIISSLILNSIMFIFLINKTVSIFSPKP